MSSEDEEMGYDSPDEENLSASTTVALPAISKSKYDKVYDDFQKWHKKLGAKSPISEDLLMTYFTELADRSKPTTLWTYHSMLKATLKFNDDIDIGMYTTLVDFIRKTGAGYKPNKKNFTEADIEKFINEASDEKYLHVKVQQQRL